MNITSKNYPGLSVTLKEEVLTDRKYRKIHTQSWVPETPHCQLVLVHGFAEHMRKYNDFARQLALKGVMVHMMDLPGHGMSEGERGHINDFTELTDNLDWFFCNNPRHRTDIPTFLFGHSMGALISSLFCIHYHPDIRGMIAVSPLTGFHFWKTLPFKWMAKLISIKSPDALLPKPMGYKQLCRNPEKWMEYRQDPIRVHTISPKMYLSFFKFTEQLQNKAQRLKCPVLLFNTLKDTVVSSNHISRFFRRIGSKDKSMIFYTQAMHELIQEPEEKQLLSIMYQWMMKRK